jgi:hypothetical protein
LRAGLSFFQILWGFTMSNRYSFPKKPSKMRCFPSIQLAFLGMQSWENRLLVILYLFKPEKFKFINQAPYRVEKRM